MFDMLRPAKLSGSLRPQSVKMNSRIMDELISYLLKHGTTRLSILRILRTSSMSQWYSLVSGTHSVRKRSIYIAMKVLRSMHTAFWTIISHIRHSRISHFPLMVCKLEIFHTTLMAQIHTYTTYLCMQTHLFPTATTPLAFMYLKAQTLPLFCLIMFNTREIYSFICVCAFSNPTTGTTPFCQRPQKPPHQYLTQQVHPQLNPQVDPQLTL